MPTAATLIVPLILTLAVVEAVVVVDRTATETHVWQPSEKEERTGRGAAVSRDQAYGKPLSTEADASTDRYVVVGQPTNSIDKVLSNSDSVAPKGQAIVAANGKGAVASVTEGSSKQCAVSNGPAGGGATGRPATGNGTAVGGSAVATGINVTAVGGNATAACYAFGGDAVVIFSSSDISSLINNSSGGDFWALLRALISEFYSKVPARRRGGSADVHAGCGSRAVGGSAVFRAGHGGRAVGGSATILGVVGGKLQVLRHAFGEISNVSGRVASGGVVTFP